MRPQSIPATLAAFGLATIALAGCTSTEGSAPGTQPPSSARTAPAGCTTDQLVAEPLSSPADGAQISAFYATTASVPQAESCDGMRRFISTAQSGFDLQSYVFYGHLEGTDGTTIPFSTLSQRSSVGASSGTASSSDVAALTVDLGDGIVMAPFVGSGETAPVLTSNPFSARFSSGPTFLDARVVSGQLGQPGAVVEITTVAAAIDGAGNPDGELQVSLRATDAAGVAQWGYGPSGFFPQWILPEQRTEIEGTYDGSIGAYLAASDNPMTNQGSYYYTSPFLTVSAFTITHDGEVVASGTGGQLVADYVTQTFDEAAHQVVDNGVTWTEFTTLLGADQAMKIGRVDQASVGSMPYAMLVGRDGNRLDNGSLATSGNWKMGDITITPDPASAWTSPHSKLSYELRYTVTLGGDGGGTLSYSAVVPDQEIDVAGRTVYEGVFTVTGTLDGRDVSGYAWGEIQPSGTL